MSQYAIEPFAPEPPESPDESAEATIVRLMARYNLNRAVCLEMIDEVMESFGQRDVASNRADGKAIQDLIARQRQAWHILVAYQANQKTVTDMVMSTRCMALELGYYTVAGADNVAELARQLGIKKQTVNKCAANFQTKLGLPPRPGQRCETARANMTEARREQLSNDKSSESLPRPLASENKISAKRGSDSPATHG